MRRLRRRRVSGFERADIAHLWQAGVGVKWNTRARRTQMLHAYNFGEERFWRKKQWHGGNTEHESMALSPLR